MKRSTIILFIDSISFIGFLFLTSTGVLLHYLLPPGSGRWSSIWGMNRHEWGEIHFWISVIFFSVLSLHTILHWKVIANLVKGRASRDSTLRLSLGLVSAIVVILLTIAPLLSPTEKIESDTGRHQHGAIHNK